MKVFISHQKLDRNQAEEIANYLRRANIPVYFDEYDRELQQAALSNDPNGVVRAIKKGIKDSTHMLCIVSPNTLSSEWVPFEIGYGHDIIILASLTLKGIADSDLPDYIKTAPIIRGFRDLVEFLKEHSTDISLRATYESMNNFSKQASGSNPLSSIMDA